jgi:DNA polymerase/3'-5' exonuclease PolX
MVEILEGTMNMSQVYWSDGQDGISVRLANVLHNTNCKSKEDIINAIESGLIFRIRGYGLKSHLELLSRLELPIPKLSKGNFTTLQKRAVEKYNREKYKTN